MKAPGQAHTNIITHFNDSVKTLVDWFSTHPNTNGIEAEKAFWQALNTSLNYALQECFSLLGNGYTERQLPCQCGSQTMAHSLRSKTFVTTTGPLELERFYYYCPQCKQGRFPLDEQLGLSQVAGQGSLTPLVATQLLLLASALPFEQAAQFQSELTRVQVSPETVRQISEGAGATLEKHAQALEEAAFPQIKGLAPRVLVAPPPAEVQPLILYGSLDGAMTPIRPIEGASVEQAQAHYEESKLACFYQTRPLTEAEQAAEERSAKRENREEWERERSHAFDQSYVSYLGGPQPLGQRAWLESVRRGALSALILVFIADGAGWIWNMVAEHWPGAVQILDWYHACEHLATVGVFLYGEGVSRQAERARWYKQQQSALWQGQAEVIVKKLQALSNLERLGEREREGLRREAAYFKGHYEAGRLAYAAFREKGYQIGSGTMESGCKQVIKARMCGSGMHWGREGAQALENVRSYILSGRRVEVEQLFFKAA